MEYRVNKDNLLEGSLELLSRAKSLGVESEDLGDVCLAICAEDSESGTNVQYLDEDIFCTVSSDGNDIARLLGEIGLKPMLEDEGVKAVPKVQFFRVFGDALAILFSKVGVSLQGLYFLSESSKEVSRLLGVSTIHGVYDDASMQEVYNNFECMLSATKVDYVRPYRNLVDNYIDKILVEYTKLFESGFGSRKPVGMMSTEGLYFVDNEVLMLDTAFDANGNCDNYDYADLCSVLSLDLGFRASESFFFDPSDAIVNSNYIPRLLLYFALGCVPSNNEHYRRHEYANNWVKYKNEVIRPYLRDTVFSKYIEALVKAGKGAEDVREGMDALLDTLTRCCLVVEWDMKVSLKCRITSVTVDFTDSAIPEQLFEKIYQSVGEIVTRKQNGFLEFKLIKDVKKYNSEPLFAYEALDDMLSNKLMPSWERVILGRLANDMTFTYDMSKNLGYHVVAASRMGKGVMCLGILASALGSKYPVFYLDSKPDMAITIHDICPDAAVCTAEQCTSLGISESSFTALLPKYAVSAMGADTYDAFGGIIYAKMLQLLLLIAEVRFKVREGGWTNISREELGWSASKNTWTKLIAFVDELEKATVHLNDELTILKAKSEPFLASKKQMQESASDDGSVNKLINGAPDYAVFASRVMDWEKKLCSDLNMGSKAVMGKGQLQMIFIYQSFEQSDEAKKDHNIEGIFNTLKGFPRTAKIIGGGANYYPDAALKITELGGVLNEEKRWFSLSTCEQSVLAKQSRVIEQLDKGTVVPFKPYLLLNSSDIDSACVTEFLNGDAGRYERYVKDGAIFEPRIGFEPYVNYMLSVGGSQESVSQLLKQGAVIAEHLLSRLGYPSINSFLFDMSIKSFKSISEWLELLRTNKKVEASDEVFNSGVSFDSNSFKNSETPKSVLESHTQNASERRKKLMDEYNAVEPYYPTIAEVKGVIQQLVTDNKPRYDSIFTSDAQLTLFSRKIVNYVKENGGIEL